MVIHHYKSDKKPGDSNKNFRRKIHSPAIKPCHPVNSARTLGWNPFSGPFFHPNPSLGKFAFLRQASLQEGQAGRLRRALLGQQDHGTAPRLLKVEQKKMALRSWRGSSTLW